MIFNTLVCSTKGQVAAAANTDDEVRFFDSQTGRQLSLVRASYDLGLRRIKLSSMGDKCFTASYENKRLVCIDVERADLMWSRGTRASVQLLSLSRNEEILYCGLDDDSTDLLSVQTGEVQKALSPVEARCVYESPTGNYSIRDRKKTILIDAGGEHLGEISLQSFAMISHCFSPHFLGLSESAGIVRFFSLESLQESWEHQPRVDSHFLSLVYAGTADTFWGMEWPYVRGGPYRFLELDAARKSVKELSVIDVKGGIAAIDSMGRGFARSGSIYSIHTGEEIGRLQFE